MRTLTNKDLEQLTRKERVTFDYISLGMDKHQVAHHMGRHVKTIETHRENIKKKLKIPSCTLLTYLAVQFALRSSRKLSTYPGTNLNP